MKPINEQIESRTFEEEPRQYLGISNLGEPCKRALWYDFRLCTVKQPISARQKRLFGRGHFEELIVVNDLLSIPGAKVEYIEIGESIREIFKNVFDHDLPPTKQKKVEFCHGHGSGHSDGVFVIERRKLLEVKTSKEKDFFSLKKSRDLLKVKPLHYIQINCYMKLLGLDECLYIMVNKETDERVYLEIKLDKEFAQAELDRATKIIFMKKPPERISDDSNYYRCRPFICKVEGVEKPFCEHRQVCHFDKRFRRSCRTCKFVELHDKGRWKCTKKKKFLEFTKQLKGCKKYVKLQ